MTSGKYIDVLVTRVTRVLADCIIRSMGRTGSDFSVGSDCLNAVKAGPDKKMLRKHAESSAVGLPGAGNWTAILYEGVV